MKTTIAFALTLLIAGCGRSTRVAYNTLAAAPPEKPKYPAVLVFEGGKGDPISARPEAKATPLWRLFLCLGKAAGPVKGEVELDFSKLGHALESERTDGASKEVLFKERLEKVTLAYEYTASFTGEKTSIVIGSTEIGVKSKQSWKEIFKKEGYAAEHREEHDSDFFNFTVAKNSLAFSGVARYSLDSEPYYLAKKIIRYVYNGPAGTTQTAGPCETENKPAVFVDLTKN